jgi:ATPase
VRPDFTIFDEVRTTKDFEVYSDFRLSGVGMVGVVHSSSAIDAIQRFIGRIELGMLPSIIDTIIFIEGGDISSVLVIKMTVKVPSGLRDRDLARPVVEVRDYKTRQLEYEIYSFGQDIVINPIRPRRTKERSSQYRELTKYGRKKPKMERINLEIEIMSDRIILKAAPEHASQNIVIFSNHEEIFTGSLSRKGEINLSLSNKEGRKILKEFDRKRDIYAKIK